MTVDGSVFAAGVDPPLEPPPPEVPPAVGVTAELALLALPDPTEFVAVTVNV